MTKEEFLNSYSYITEQEYDGEAKMKNDDREFLKLENKEMDILLEVLEIKELKCFYCGKKLNKEYKFSIFNKPTRIVCNNILCLTKAIREDEDN